MAVAICINTRDAEAVLAALRVRLPGLGALTAFRDKIGSLPDPSESVGKYIAILNAALMPLKQIMDILEVVVAIVNCLNSVIDAVEQLSPQPVIDCLGNLTEIMGRILQYIPPFPYIIAIADILRVFIVYLDEIIFALAEINARIQALDRVRARAAVLGDSNLQFVANCKQVEVDQMRRNAFEGILVVARIVGLIFALIRGIVRLVPAISRTEVDAIEVRLTGIEADISNAIAGPSVGLTAISVLLRDLRAILVDIYRLLATPIGQYVEVAVLPTVSYVT